MMGGEKNYYVTALAGNFFNLILLCQRVRSLGSLWARRFDIKQSRWAEGTTTLTLF